jgi:hypothetical protein
LPPGRRAEIAQKAAIARWGNKLPRATHKYAYENRIAERFGGQIELELVVPTPSVIPAVPEDDYLIRN